jgi:peptidoglycan/xylan/chitin deacetylase (PgdA/CDA1 family)
MNRNVTIVMYHYVRDLEHSRFPAIKGLSLSRFRRQLEHIESEYTPVAVEDLFEALEAPATELPENAILLTFDDGYSDHFLNVFPLLDARGIKGCFFPPARAVLEHIVLDVNKIQFVLAAVPDARKLLEEILDILEGFRSQNALRAREEYLASVTEQHRYDVREVTVIKRLLQRELPELIRSEIVCRLFEKYVTSDEAAFASELYMSIDQIDCLRRHGMHIGSHGYSHAWLNHIPQREQSVETDRSLDFLKMVGAGDGNWTMCYPYGGFNDSLLQILRERACRLGFTVEPRVADLNADDRLTLPRIDTNDLPS